MPMYGYGGQGLMSTGQVVKTNDKEPQTFHVSVT